MTKKKERSFVLIMILYLAGIFMGAIVQMQEGDDGVGQGIDGMNQGIAAQKQAKAQLDSAITMLSAFKGGNLPEGMTVASLIPESVKGQIPQGVVTELEGVNTLDSAVPGAFDTARDEYLKAIDDRSAQIETVFQNDLNRGFQNVYLTAAIAALAGLIVLQFYSKKQEMANVQSEG